MERGPAPTKALNPICIRNSPRKLARGPLGPVRTVRTGGRLWLDLGSEVRVQGLGLEALDSMQELYLYVASNYRHIRKLVLMAGSVYRYR